MNALEHRVTALEQQQQQQPSHAQHIPETKRKLTLGRNSDAMMSLLLALNEPKAKDNEPKLEVKDKEEEFKDEIKAEEDTDSADKSTSRPTMSDAELTRVFRGLFGV